MENFQYIFRQHWTFMFFSDVDSEKGRQLVAGCMIGWSDVGLKPEKTSSGLSHYGWRCETQQQFVQHLPSACTCR